MSAAATSAAPAPPAARSGDRRRPPRAMPNAARTQTHAARTGLLGVIVFASAILVTLPGWLGPCGLSPDSVDYLETARSILAGGPFSPRSALLPPGLPLLIALASVWLTEPWRIAGPLNGLCLAATAWLTWRMAACRLSRWHALAAGMLVAVSPALLEPARFLWTEPLFTLTIVATLALLEPRGSDDHPPTTRRLLAVGAVAGIAICARWNGILLLPAIAWQMLARRTPGQMRLAALPRVALVACVALAPATLWKFHVAPYAPRDDGFAVNLLRPRDGEPAGTPLELAARRFRAHAPAQAAGLARMILPPNVAWSLYQQPWGGPAALAVGGLIALLLLGFTVVARAASGAFALLTVALLCVWPWDEGDRLLAPLTPLVTLAVVRTVAALGSHPFTLFRVGSAASLGLISCLQLAETAVELQRLPDRRARHAQMFNHAAQIAASCRRAAPHPVVAVTRDGDAAKVALLLARYHTYGRLQVRECAPGQPGRPLSTAIEYVIAPLPTQLTDHFPQEARPLGQDAAFGLFPPRAAPDSR